MTEQALGQPLDPRCDLFAFGVISWELLAGRRLFARENDSATLLAMVADPIPPIGAARPDIDPAWGPFLERALARNVEERFSSASEMADELDRIRVPAGRRGSDELSKQVEAALALPERRSQVESEMVTQVDSAGVAPSA